MNLPATTPKAFLILTFFFFVFLRLVIFQLIGRARRASPSFSTTSPLSRGSDDFWSQTVDPSTCAMISRPHCGVDRSPVRVRVSRWRTWFGFLPSSIITVRAPCFHFCAIESLEEKVPFTSPLCMLCESQRHARACTRVCVKDGKDYTTLSSVRVPFFRLLLG